MIASQPNRRRVVISLAALVDLLFVVMFLQFVELQQVNASLEGAKTSAEQSQKDAERLKDDALADQGKVVDERNARERPPPPSPFGLRRACMSPGEWPP